MTRAIKKRPPPADSQPVSGGASAACVWPVFGALMLALLLASLDQTIVATALPSIVRELGGLYELAWVVTA